MFRENLTLNEIFDILEDEKGTCDVFSQPPDANDEDGSERLHPYNLSDNQLLSVADLHQRRSSEAEDNEDISQINPLMAASKR